MTEKIYVFSLFVAKFVLNYVGKPIVCVIVLKTSLIKSGYFSQTNIIITIIIPDSHACPTIGNFTKQLLDFILLEN